MNETVGQTAEEDISASDPAGLFGPEERFGADYYKLLMEQYKLYVDSSTKLSERRATAQTFFLTANTLLATASGLAAGRYIAPAAAAAADGTWQWLVPLAGLLLALSWFVLIGAYRTLNSAKFKVIHELERQLPARLFEREWHFTQEKKGGLTLTRVERVIPLIFALFFAALMGQAFLPI